jgi:hypothetical protein
LRAPRTSTFWKPYRNGSMPIRKRCGKGEKRSSIRSARSRLGWERHTSRCARSEGRDRDGAGRARLQSHAGDEHHGREAADRRDEGVRGGRRPPQLARASPNQSRRSLRAHRRHPKENLLQTADPGYSTPVLARAGQHGPVLTQPRPPAVMLLVCIKRVSHTPLITETIVPTSLFKVNLAANLMGFGA